MTTGWSIGENAKLTRSLGNTLDKRDGAVFALKYGNTWVRIVGIQRPGDEIGVHSGKSEGTAGQNSEINMETHSKKMLSKDIRERSASGDFEL